MKAILLPLMFLILIPNSEKVSGTYKIIDELSDDTLELKENGNYVYKEWGDSCWTWYDFKGEWEINQGILILTEKREKETLKHIFRVNENELVLTKSESLIEGKRYKKL